VEDVEVDTERPGPTGARKLSESPRRLPWVVTVDKGDCGGCKLPAYPILLGAVSTCCRAKVDPPTAGLTGEREGKDDIGDGGTNGNLANTESACEDAVLELKIELGRMLRSS